MSDIVVTSTTSSTEKGTQNMGDLSREDAIVDKKSAPITKNVKGETKEDDSDTSKNDDDANLEVLEDSEDESDNDDSDAKEGDQKPKKNRPGFKKKIVKLSKKLSAKEQEVEYWKQEALKGRSNASEDKPNKITQKAETTGKPNPNDFDSHEEFTEALTDWKIEEREKVKTAKARETEVQTEFQKQVDTYKTRAQDFSKSHDDFDEVMDEVDDIRMSLAVQNAILESENGPELAYELAKNREEYERINALTPQRAAYELGKFEAKIKRASESNEKKETKTKAPPPITPLKAKGTSVKKSIFDPNLSQAEYEKLRREEMRKNA